MSENGQWHWQEPGEAWKGVGIYHITLTVPSREPLLGSLIIPNDDPKQAWVERTELGNNLVNEIYNLGTIHPQVRILQFCLMPDHMHLLLHLRQSTSASIRSIIRGFWQGAKRLGREFTLSIAPECNTLSIAPECNTLSIDPEFNSGTTNKVNEDTLHHAYPIFTEQPFIRPMSRHGQLQTMFDYVRLNPQRLATKRLMPEYFWVQQGIEIAGRTYAGVGNSKLLMQGRYMPVHVRHTWVEEAEQHGDNTHLRNYMNSCVIAARQGAVMVSPFISPQEKMVQQVLLREGHPFIYIADNGFSDYYKPSAALFDAVADGRVLILSPWEYDPKKKRVTMAQCAQMNKMAEEISSSSISTPAIPPSSISPEFNSGLTNEGS